MSAALIKSVVYWVLTCLEGESINYRALFCKSMAEAFENKYPNYYSSLLQSMSRTEESADSADFWENVVSEIILRYPNQALPLAQWSYDRFSYELPFALTMVLTLDTLESFEELANASLWTSSTNGVSGYQHAKDRLTGPLKSFYGEQYDRVRERTKKRFSGPQIWILDMLGHASKEPSEWIDWPHLVSP